MLSQLNHLYLLLSRFYGGRFERPYHFHGAALVACELSARGYSTHVTALTGNFLGEFYERTTSLDARPDPEDLRLHRDGTRYGIELCAAEATHS